MDGVEEYVPGCFLIKRDKESYETLRYQLPKEYYIAEELILYNTMLLPQLWAFAPHSSASNIARYPEARKNYNLLAQYASDCFYLDFYKAAKYKTRQLERQVDYFIRNS